MWIALLLQIVPGSNGHYAAARAVLWFQTYLYQMVPKLLGVDIVMVPAPCCYLWPACCCGIVISAKGWQAGKAYSSPERACACAKRWGMKPRTLSGGLKVLHALCTRLCPDVPRSASWLWHGASSVTGEWQIRSLSCNMSIGGLKYTVPKMGTKWR